jgi:hypothetical protein
MGSPSGTSVTGHANGGQASDQASQVKPGRCRHPAGHVISKARRNGQIFEESPPGTSPEPDGDPPKTAAPTLTEFWVHYVEMEAQMRATAAVLPCYGVADWSGQRFDVIVTLR